MSEARKSECIRTLVTVLRQHNATAAGVKRTMKGHGFTPTEIYEALDQIDAPTPTDKGTDT